MKIKKGDVFDDLRHPLCHVKATVISVITTEPDELIVFKYWVKHKRRWVYEVLHTYIISLWAENKRFNKRSNKRKK